MALTFDRARKLFRIGKPRRVRLKDFDPAWKSKDEFTELTMGELKARATEFLAANTKALADAQERPYASDTHAIVQETFERGARSQLSLALYEALPERGRIGIFNRSYYEDVLVVRVHKELLQSQRLPNGHGGRKCGWNATTTSIASNAI